jgi:hypothetical protein
MASIAWLASPYLSLLVLRRWRWSRNVIAGHSALTVPAGWVAVLVLALAVLGAWSLPLPVLAACAALSGAAMLLPGRGGEDDDDAEDDDEPRPPEIDWDDFDDRRRRWGEPRTGPPVAPRSARRAPSRSAWWTSA